MSTSDLKKLKDLLPGLSSDPHFVLSFGYFKNVKTPIVYLSEDEPKVGYMPAKYIIIFKKDDLQEIFAIQFVHFYNGSFGVPLSFWPYLVGPEQLEKIIRESFEGWETLKNELPKNILKSDTASYPL